MIDRIVNTSVTEEEHSEGALENSLRPKDFANYIGQEKLKKNLKIKVN